MADLTLIGNEQFNIPAILRWIDQEASNERGSTRTEIQLFARFARALIAERGIVTDNKTNKARAAIAKAGGEMTASTERLAVATNLEALAKECRLRISDRPETREYDEWLVKLTIVMRHAASLLKMEPNPNGHAYGCGCDGCMDYYRTLRVA